MTRHNWKFVGMGTSRATHICVGESQATVYRSGANCFGCGAEIPYDVDWKKDARMRDLSLDAMWAKELRPMAALCLMVEEASE